MTMVSKNLPWWACPITKKLMLDPVIAADGRTYERAAIEELIAQNPRGPVIAPGSNFALKHALLRPDKGRRIAIEDWIKSQPEEVQKGYQQRKTAQVENPRLVLEAIKESGDSFFEQLPAELLSRIFGHDMDVLTLSECKNLAQAGIPGVSEYFKVAIGAANLNVRKFLDHVRRGESAIANQMLADDPALLTLKDVKIAKLFLHMLRGKAKEVGKMRAEDPNLLPDNELKISEFLVHVSTENLEEAEKMLKADPGLLFKKGPLVDFGLRRFTEASKEGEPRGIYPLQYADAAEDKSGPMLGLLRRYCPVERKAELEKQLEESRSKEDNNNYKALENARHSLVAMRDAMVAFVEIIKPLDTDEKYRGNEQEVEAAWRVVVEKQLELVSCWIHLWTEAGRGVAWNDASARECQSMDPKNIIMWYNSVGRYEDQARHRVGMARAPHGEQVKPSRSYQWATSSLRQFLGNFFGLPSNGNPDGNPGDNAKLHSFAAQKLSQLVASTQAAVHNDFNDESAFKCSIQ